MTQEAELMHYGILRKSGRYPWGSGKDEYTRSRTLQGMVEDLKRQGLTEKDIIKGLGLKPEVEAEFSITNLRDSITIAKETVVKEETNQAVALKAKGMSIQAISERMGIKEPTVRLRLKNSERVQKESLKATAEAVRKEVDKYQIVDIGKGNNIHMGISPERFRTAVSILKDEGYEAHTLQIKQPGSRHSTNQLVLVPPGTGWGNANRMQNQIHTMATWSEDGGKTYLNMHSPMSISSKRLAIAHESDKDGVVYIRPGVKDLNMGKNQYAQVRIMIDGTHFIKGMAILSDDIPAGKDLLFHTDKTSKTPVLGPSNNSILKPKKDDPDNPFGSSISKQIVTIDPKTGKQKLTSAINMVNETGDWETWSNSLPSQMLAKQPQSLIKSQLGVTKNQAQEQIDKINTITSPVLRRKQLEKLADQIDSDAVDLRAAAMPRQRTQVIIPVPKMNKNEIYAPRFQTGERVVLIRYPHGGKFEIPEVTVNNNNRTAKKLLGNAVDAIGIHPAVAQKLSGADFDGDTVVVIPNSKGLIRGASTLGRAGYVIDKQLGSFNPKEKYGGFIESGKDAKGDPVGNFKLMKNTGMEMGKITNLITDMQVQGAGADHLVRAVKHSMVVIDAEKHSLDYKRSEIENGIPALKKIYQGSEKHGATTLLSKATAKPLINERKLRGAKAGGPIDPKTGAKVFVDTGRTINKFDPKTGLYDASVKVPVMKRDTKNLALTQDAHTLVSPNKHPVEVIYADHANTMKGIANSTRLAASRIPTPIRNPAAKKVYKAEYDDLVAQLHRAEAQKPLDRHAQVIANAVIKQKRQEDPTLRFDKDRMLKVERQAKEGVRFNMGLHKPEIVLTDRAWDAIQAGAISSNIFKKILDGNYVKEERLFELAIPRKNTVMSTPILSRAKAMLAAGMTNGDIAANLGISASTLRAAVVRGEL